MKTKISQAQLQQGDVLMLPVSALPKGCKTIKDRRGVVLAEGEVTGHYHGIAEEEGEVALMEAPDGRRFVVNSGEKPVTLTHQEHKPVIVAPGAYQVGIVREKDWFQDMVRNVQD